MTNYSKKSRKDRKLKKAALAFKRTKERKIQDEEDSKAIRDAINNVEEFVSNERN